MGEATNLKLASRISSINSFILGWEICCVFLRLMKGTLKVSSLTQKGRYNPGYSRKIDCQNKFLFSFLPRFSSKDQ